MPPDLILEKQRVCAFNLKIAPRPPYALTKPPLLTCHCVLVCKDNFALFPFSFLLSTFRVRPQRYSSRPSHFIFIFIFTFFFELILSVYLFICVLKNITYLLLNIQTIHIRPPHKKNIITSKCFYLLTSSFYLIHVRISNNSGALNIFSYILQYIYMHINKICVFFFF